MDRHVGHARVGPARAVDGAGDFVISPAAGGFVIWRVIALGENGGPWWELVKSFKSLKRAIAVARGMAAPAKGSVWLYDDQQNYRKLWPDELV